jgi:hypothetical protein
MRAASWNPTRRNPQSDPDSRAKRDCPRILSCQRIIPGRPVAYLARMICEDEFSFFCQRAHGDYDAVGGLHIGPGGGAR